jgi:hypothetical protein
MRTRTSKQISLLPTLLLKHNRTLGEGPVSGGVRLVEHGGDYGLYGPDGTHSADT